MTCDQAHSVFPVALAALIVGVGCNTLKPQDRSLIAGLQADVDDLKARVAELGGQIEAVKVVQEDIRRDVRMVEEKTNKKQVASGKRVADLDRRINAVDAARRKDLDKIITELSKKMVQVINKQRSSGRRTVGAGTHVVRKGETLSEIALKYGVTVEAMVEANGLRNPNAVSVGQELVVPQ